MPDKPLYNAQMNETNITKDEVHMNMELVQIIKVNDKYWFVLRDVPETEMAFVKMQSDIEYVAMMSEIEL